MVWPIHGQGHAIREVAGMLAVIRANAEKRRTNPDRRSKVNIIYIMGHSPKRPTALKRHLGRVGTRTHGGLPHSLRKIRNQAVPPQTIGRRPADLRQTSAAGRILLRALAAAGLTGRDDALEDRRSPVGPHIVFDILRRKSETITKDASWHHFHKFL